MKSRIVFAESESNISLCPDHHSYMDYCLELSILNLHRYGTIGKLAADSDKTNAYREIAQLANPRHLLLLDQDMIHDVDYGKTYKCILDGELLAEHAVAGEATRLGLGTKFLIDIQKNLSCDRIAQLMTLEQQQTVTAKDVLEMAGTDPAKLLPLSLGVRHMLQYSFDIYRLAQKMHCDPYEVLSKQKLLIIVNEETASNIIETFIRHRFYGFAWQNVFFMIQKAYYGINLENDEVFYDVKSPRRLHNHGQIAISQTMDNQIFTIDESGGQTILTSEMFGGMLKSMKNKVSYNIEDLEYLVGAIDYAGLSLALKKGRQGYGMVMEVLPNNPKAPQKGGMLAYDPNKERDVMIESFALDGIENHKIKYLNKNVNHYPNPFYAWEMVRKHGLNMPIKGVQTA